MFVKYKNLILEGIKKRSLTILYINRRKFGDEKMGPLNDNFPSFPQKNYFIFFTGRVTNILPGMLNNQFE